MNGARFLSLTIEQDMTCLLVSPSVSGLPADTLYFGDSGGIAEHAVQVLLQALVLLCQLLHAPGQVQQGTAHLLLPLHTQLLLHYGPEDKQGTN